MVYESVENLNFEEFCFLHLVLLFRDAEHSALCLG